MRMVSGDVRCVGWGFRRQCMGVGGLGWHVGGMGREEYTLG